MTGYICDSGKCEFADDGSVYKGTLSDTLSFDFTFTDGTYPKTSDYRLNIQSRKQGDVDWNTCKTVMIGNSEEWKAGKSSIRVIAGANECAKEFGVYEFRVTGSSCGGACYTLAGATTCAPIETCTYPAGKDAGQCISNPGCVMPSSSTVKMESNTITILLVKEMKPPDVYVKIIAVDRPELRDMNKLLDTDKITFLAYASDESGVDKITNYLDENNDGIYDKSFTCKSTLCTLPASTYPAGTVSYYASAWDSIGNRGDSIVAKVSILPSCPSPPAPSCSDAQPSSLKMSWDIIKGSTDYITEFCPSTESFGSDACINKQFGMFVGESLYEWRYTELTGGTDYKMRGKPRAVNNIRCGSHSWSAPITCATTPATNVPPPVRNKGGPKGSLSALTDTVSLSLETSEPSGCRYDTVPGKSYNQMSLSHRFKPASLDENKPAMIHTFIIRDLQPGNQYNYYVKCVGTNTGVANTDDYVISFKIPAYDIFKYSACPDGQVVTDSGDCVDPMTLVGYPTDSDCTAGWPYGGSKADAKLVMFSGVPTETTYVCNVFEVKNHDLLQIAKSVATCFSTKCSNGGGRSCHSLCKEDYKKSGADTVRSVDTFKRFAGYYIIDGFGSAATFMKDYFWPEVHSGLTGTGYCGPKGGFNGYAQQLESRGIVGSPWGWASDEDMTKNSCILSVLPAHASINILHTGTCADYSAAVTTMLRYVGYKSDEVYSVLLNIHMYNLVKFPLDDLWHIADTVGNVGGGVDAKWVWTYGYKDYTHCDYGGANSCVNDNGPVKCPPRSEVYAC